MPKPPIWNGGQAAQVVRGMLRDHLAALDQKINQIAKAISERRAGKGEAAALQYLLSNRRQIQDQISGTTTRDLANYVSGQLQTILSVSSGELRKLGFERGLLMSDVNAASFARQNIITWFETASRESSKQVFAGLLKYVNTGSKAGLQRMIGEIGQEKYFRYGDTIVHSHLNAFYQDTNNRRSLEIGVKRFRYDGPPPQRDFCQALYRKVFTKEEIDQMDNGQTPNVFLTCGGYNCPHRWIPIAPTRKDRAAPAQTPAQARARVNGIQIGDRTAADSGRAPIYIKDGKRYTNEIKRSIKRDEKTGDPYYMRYTGDRQYLKQDKNGNYFIDAFGPGNQAPKGPLGPGGQGPRLPPAPRPPPTSQAPIPRPPEPTPQPEPIPSAQPPRKARIPKQVKKTPSEIYAENYKGPASTQEFLSGTDYATWGDENEVFDVKRFEAKTKKLLSDMKLKDPAEIERRYSELIDFTIHPLQAKHYGEVKKKIEADLKEWLSYIHPNRYKELLKDGKIKILNETNPSYWGSYGSKGSERPPSKGGGIRDFHEMYINFDAYKTKPIDGFGTVFHEMTHYMDKTHNLKYKGTSISYFRSMTIEKGEQLLTKEIDTGHGILTIYYYKDDFYDPYQGRVYPSEFQDPQASEMQSMTADLIGRAIRGDGALSLFLQSMKGKSGHDRLKLWIDAYFP